MVAYRDRNNEIVSLGTKLGEGKEGKVFAVSNNHASVAKVWKSPNPEAAAKIEIMLGNRPAVPNSGGSLFVPHIPFAWPEDILKSDGKVAGFLMPKIDTGSFVEIFRYYNPEARQKLEQARGVEYRDEDFLSMARNLAEAVGHVHRAGYVIGDINQKNVLADGRARVVIIDCDSMQVCNPQTNKTYPCKVHVPDYTPPGLAGAERTKNHDCFGLAVLIFQLLMRGLHPYQITDSQDQATNSQAQTTADKIGRGVFPYKDTDSGQHNSEIARRFKANWSNMKPGLRRCFREAFAPDYNSPRPSPTEWVDELDRLIKPTATGNSRSLERRLEEMKGQLQVANRERLHAEDQLNNERLARNQAGQALQDKNQQLADERRGRKAAEQRFQKARQELETLRHESENSERQLVLERNARSSAEAQLADARRERDDARQTLSTQKQAEAEVADQRKRKRWKTVFFVCIAIASLAITAAIPLLLLLF